MIKYNVSRTNQILVIIFWKVLSVGPPNKTSNKNISAYHSKEIFLLQN